MWSWWILFLPTIWFTWGNWEAPFSIPNYQFPARSAAWTVDIGEMAKVTWVTTPLGFLNWISVKSPGSNIAISKASSWWRAIMEQVLNMASAFVWGLPEKWLPQEYCTVHSAVARIQLMASNLEMMPWRAGSLGILLIGPVLLLS